MEQGIREVLRGVRPLDGVLAGALTALGVLLMVFNVLDTPAESAAAVAEGSMVHVTSSHSWWMVPVFVVATVAVLWWRRGVTEVATVAAVAMGVHVLLFDWVTRCGAALPLVLVLGYLAGLAERGRRRWAAAAVLSVLSALVLVRDATTGIEPLVIVLPLLAVLLVVGGAVRQRTVMADELRRKGAELAALRDERAALVVADDRQRLTEQLDGLLQARLGRLATVADGARDLDPVRARAALVEIEADGRQMLEEMREVVGRLRGDAALAPLPATAHLDALLARRAGPGSHLTVTGDPTGLPASVELSVYRIVEHLVEALRERESGVEVTVLLDGPALEICVEGRAARGAAVRAALARARERARVVGGTLEVTTVRGRALAVAAVPVPDRV
ncbi:hypothetical protein G7075_05620 [Phycicoccus sp. HDW14]|uniref:hypothetical protein n=1 Tax=Phycicoccus sp. HDW14 TaxID=2714941 RepID=UPI00140917DB|nr:hypothetical protein [Phycicoccus sp. HDW14]QIM20747.1 hypothetical protein G7075_05620 [Phycicoccus sp. HDW14]